MKKLLLACALSVAALAPAAALAADPSPSDFKNAAKYCKALKSASGSNFASMFGTKKNAYGKCVSQTARQRANEDAAQEKAAKANAAKQCKAEQQAAGAGAPKNAYGKCVSQRAKQLKAAADKEDEAQEGDRVNAARSCKQARKSDPAKFAKDYGTRRNAFGKCVSRTAKQLQDQRRAQDAPTA